MFGENINNVHRSTETLLAASKKFGLERDCEKPNVCTCLISRMQVKARHKDN